MTGCLNLSRRRLWRTALAVQVAGLPVVVDHVDGLGSFLILQYSTSQPKLVTRNPKGS